MLLSGSPSLTSEPVCWCTSYNLACYPARLGNQRKAVRTHLAKAIAFHRNLAQAALNGPNLGLIRTTDGSMPALQLMVVHLSTADELV